MAFNPYKSLWQLRIDTSVYITVATLLILAAYAWGLLIFLHSLVVEKNAHIEAARAHERVQVLQRQQELETRFYLLAEATSAGLVVVNPAGTIVLSNTAAEALFRYSKDQLRGWSIENLLPPEHRMNHMQFRSAFFEHPTVRKMGQGRELSALTADGRRIPVEIGLNPYLDHGEQMVLATIIELP